MDERGLSFEDLKLDGEGTFCLKVSSWMRGDFRLKISRLDGEGTFVFFNYSSFSKSEGTLSEDTFCH